MRDGIRRSFMNRQWMERQKRKANLARFRDSENSQESPSEYYIRKLELLEFVFDYTEQELIFEILNCAPVIWTSLLNPHQFQGLVELQDTIRYYEETLVKLSESHTPRRNTQDDGVRVRTSHAEAGPQPGLDAGPGVASWRRGDCSILKDF